MKASALEAAVDHFLQEHFLNSDPRSRMVHDGIDCEEAGGVYLTQRDPQAGAVCVGWPDGSLTVHHRPGHPEDIKACDEAIHEWATRTENNR